LSDSDDKAYFSALKKVPGLQKLVSGVIKDNDQQLGMMEFVLNALATFEIIEKNIIGNQIIFDDPLGDIMGDLE
jgi:hypothetical protein